MDLLRTLLIYMTMIFVSSVQTAPEPTIIPEPTTIYEATATPTQVPTPSPTPVPTPDITPNPAYKTLRVGDSGDIVTELQTKLAEYGYLTGEIDGRYGNQTRHAVEQFQYSNGLQVDGVAGRYTLTMLFESNSVRPAPTPTPDPDALATAKPEADQTPIPIPEDTAAPAPATSEPESITTEAPATDAPATTAPATDAPESQPPADTLGETQAPADEKASPEADKATDAPETDVQATDTPETAAPDSDAPTEFMPMEGYSIGIEGYYEVLLTDEKADNADGADAESVPLEPCILGVDVYVPLIRILEAADVLVIPNETLDITEYAFALGEDIYRIDFTENQAGEPSQLGAYLNNEVQALPVRDIRLYRGEIYLPMESVESLVGIHFDMDDERKLLIVTMP